MVFNTLDGGKIIFKAAIREKLDKEIREKLKDHVSLPVKMTGNFVSQAVKTSRRSTSYPILEYVYSYEVVDVDELCEVAQTKGFTEEVCNTFKDHFKTTVR